MQEARGSEGGSGFEAAIEAFPVVIQLATQVRGLGWNAGPHSARERAAVTQEREELTGECRQKIAYAPLFEPCPFGVGAREAEKMAAGAELGVQHERACDLSLLAPHHIRGAETAHAGEPRGDGHRRSIRLEP